MNSNIETLLTNFLPNEMDLPSKLLEQIAYNTRPKIEEHMLIDLDKSTHDEHLAQPFQTNNKQYKVAVAFLSGYNGIFNVTNSNNKFYSKKSLIEEDFIQTTIHQGASEIESLNDERKRINFDKGHYSEDHDPITTNTNCSMLGSIIEMKPQGAIIEFVYDDSMRNLLGFPETMLYKEYNSSQNSVNILSFDSIFLECDIAKEMIFKGKPSGIIHNWTMTEDPG